MVILRLRFRWRQGAPGSGSSAAGTRLHRYRRLGDSSILSRQRRSSPGGTDRLYSLFSSLQAEVQRSSRVRRLKRSVAPPCDNRGAREFFSRLLCGTEKGCLVALEENFFYILRPNTPNKEPNCQGPGPSLALQVGPANQSHIQPNRLINRILILINQLIRKLIDLIITKGPNRG